VIHAHWYSPSGPIGVSPLQALSVTMDIEDAIRRFTVSTMKNSARPPSAITVSEDFLGREQEERKQIIELVREQITSIYSGPENAGKAAILPFGLDWKQVGHTAVETQLIEQRKISREEIAAVYQIPPPMIGILDHATYSNMAQMREMSYTDSLGPYMVLIEQQINAQLVRGLLRENDIYVEFDFAGVLRGDRLKEVQAIREAINTGVLTPNEGRTALNYPKSDDEAADSLYLSTNNLEPLATVLDPEEETPPPVPPPPSE
jgi:HK97 family phage portal protein